MRRLIIASAIVLVLALTVAFGQTPNDPHDLNGLWLAQGGGGRGGRGNAASEADAKGFLKDGGIMTQWGPSSPLTPAGLKAVNANKSGKGPRAVPPVYANDLLGDANPPGLIRALIYNRPFQLIQTPTKSFNFSNGRESGAKYGPTAK